MAIPAIGSNRFPALSMIQCHGCQRVEPSRLSRQALGKLGPKHQNCCGRFVWNPAITSCDAYNPVTSGKNYQTQLVSDRRISNKPSTVSLINNQNKQKLKLGMQILSPFCCLFLVFPPGFFVLSYVVWEVGPLALSFPTLHRTSPLWKALRTRRFGSFFDSNEFGSDSH